MDNTAPLVRSGPPGLLKACARCRQVRPVSDFRPSLANQSGYSAACNACQASMRSWRQTAKGKAYVRRNNEQRKVGW